MNKKTRNRLVNLFHNGHEIDHVVKQAVRLALEEHKKLNNPIAGWDGQSVVVIHPEHILSTTEK